MTLLLSVQPRAKKTRIVGLHDGRLKIAVKSPPVDGKANREVLKFLAGLFGLAPRDLSVKSGGQFRQKVIIVTCDNPDLVKSVLEQNL